MTAPARTTRELAHRCRHPYGARVCLWRRAPVAGRTGSNRGRRIAGDHIGISSITFSEIIYLQERRQVDPATLAPFRELTAVMERVLGSDDCHEAGREHLDPVD